MPRRPRLQLAGVPFHVIQRGNNRSACFFADDDHSFFLDHLSLLSKKHQVAVHAYVLMTNHVHLLLTPLHSTGVSALMKQLGQRYVQYVNRVYRRSGSLWEGRFRSSMVDADNYLLACQRYIELNPVRAGMVEHPADYRWSSYRTHGQGQTSDLVQSHPLYRALGGDPASRQAAYRELFRYQLDPGVVDEIRQAANAGFALGNERFREEVSLALGRRSAPGQPGRPKKRLINDVAQAALLLE